MSGTAAIVLLVLAALGLFVPQLRAWNWCPPVALALIALGVGATTPDAARHAVAPLVAPLAFVVFAVPMAVMLDRYGLFSELARRISGGTHYLGLLWLLATLVTALLNLDVAVVLLAPLYVRIAEHRGTSRLALSVQAALLSALASSALPVSNLTNLIAQAHDHASVGAFLVHLGPSTVVATMIGWWCYRAGYSRIVALERNGARRRASPAPVVVAGRPPRTTLAVGGVLVGAIVVGFTVAPGLGGQPFEVAALADLVLVALTRSFPWRSLPWESVAIVVGLGVLAAAAASHLRVGAVIGGSSPLEILRTTGVSALGANAVNNLPSLLVALPATGSTPGWGTWAVLLGTNVGALIMPSASLALLLWSSTVRRLGVAVRDGDLLRIGWWICLPALAGATATLLLLRFALGAAR